MNGKITEELFRKRSAWSSDGAFAYTNSNNQDFINDHLNPLLAKIGRGDYEWRNYQRGVRRMRNELGIPSDDLNDDRFVTLKSFLIFLKNGSNPLGKEAFIKLSGRADGNLIADIIDSEVINNITSTRMNDLGDLVLIDGIIEFCSSFALNLSDDTLKASFLNLIHGVDSEGAVETRWNDFSVFQNNIETQFRTDFVAQSAIVGAGGTTPASEAVNAPTSDNAIIDPYFGKGLTGTEAANVYHAGIPVTDLANVGVVHYDSTTGVITVGVAHNLKTVPGITSWKVARKVLEEELAWNAFFTNNREIDIQNQNGWRRSGLSPVQPSTASEALSIGWTDLNVGSSGTSVAADSTATQSGEITDLIARPRSATPCTFTYTSSSISVNSVDPTKHHPTDIQDACALLKEINDSSEQEHLIVLLNNNRNSITPDTSSPFSPPVPDATNASPVAKDSIETRINRLNDHVPDAIKKDKIEAARKAKIKEICWRMFFGEKSILDLHQASWENSGLDPVNKQFESIAVPNSNGGWSWGKLNPRASEAERVYANGWTDLAGLTFVGKMITNYSNPKGKAFLSINPLDQTRNFIDNQKKKSSTLNPFIPPINNNPNQPPQTPNTPNQPDNQIPPSSGNGNSGNSSESFTGGQTDTGTFGAISNLITDILANNKQGKPWNPQLTEVVKQAKEQLKNLVNEENNEESTNEQLIDKAKEVQRILSLVQESQIYQNPNPKTEEIITILSKEKSQNSPAFQVANHERTVEIAIERLQKLKNQVAPEKDKTSNDQDTLTENKDSGMGTGTKVALGVGIVGGIALIGGLVHFYSQKKNNPVEETL